MDLLHLRADVDSRTIKDGKTLSHGPGRGFVSNREKGLGSTERPSQLA